MIFTFVMRHPLALLHAKGVHVIAYLDDLLIWGDSPEMVQNSVDTVTTCLTGLGFSLNWQKSAPTPSKTLTWLGIAWNSANGSVTVPPTYISQIKNLVVHLLNRRRTTRRMFECLIGKINFASQISPLARLLSRPISKPQLISVREQDKSIVKIPQQLLKALQQWSNPSFLLQPSPIRHPSPSLTVWTDASTKGWGSYTSTDLSFSGLWKADQVLLHINQLELLAVDLTMQLLPPKLSVLIMSDNITTVSAINKIGSKSPSIQKFALPLTGSLEVDLFASPINHKLQTFVAPFAHPRATATDAFTLDWNQFKKIYLFPPPNAIPRVISKLRHYKGHGVFIAPYRPAAPWYPYLLKKCRLLQMHLEVHQTVQKTIVYHSQQHSVPWIAFLF